jgi:hypothetical protein
MVVGRAITAKANHQEEKRTHLLSVKLLQSNRPVADAMPGSFQARCGRDAARTQIVTVRRGNKATTYKVREERRISAGLNFRCLNTASR